MQAVLFTKLFGQRGIDEVATACADLGFDGLDLLIRPGCTVEPDTVDRLPDVVQRVRDRGLEVPMVTTDITDPDRFPTRKTLDACARSGVSLVRLGYWTYDGGARYDELLARARRDLDQLDALAAEYQLRLAVQLHGGTIHTSGATTRALLADHNPERIGAYPDPGNQAVQDGRDDWRLTFDLLSKWLCCVGVKNGGWFPADVASSGQRMWRSDWLGVADGMVPWADIIAHLVRVDFAGILSFHSHYEAPYAQVLDQTRTDLRYVRRLITGSSA
jgi:sugar phosphate isomerase/epimerase